jgi:hypothetical protein
MKNPAPKRKLGFSLKRKSSNLATDNKTTTEEFE